MHYREVPTQRPIHCFERCSDMPRWAIGASLGLLFAALFTAYAVPIGADLYCTRDRAGEQRCVLHQHSAMHTHVTHASSVRFVDAPRIIGADANSAQIVVHSIAPEREIELEAPPNALVMDGRPRRDGVDQPVYFGVWERGVAWRADALDAFRRGDSPAIFVRARAANGPGGVVASVALGVLAMCVGLVGAAQRRRYRIRFDPNSDLAWVTEGSIFRMNPERERLLDQGALRAVMRPAIKLVTSGAKPVTLFESVHAADHGLFESIAASVQRARGPIKTIARPLPAYWYAAPAIVIAALGLTLLGSIARHALSTPSDSGTLTLRATTRCNYGGVTLLPGATMQWTMVAGTHDLTVRDGRGSTAVLTARITPGGHESITCSEATFTQANR